MARKSRPVAFLLVSTSTLALACTPGFAQEAPACDVAGEEDIIVVEGVRYSDAVTPLTGAPAEIREIPNSITVLTDEIIEDQIITGFNDVL
ncbi:MAG: hypothetical protein AAGH41_05230 [Pseudomonadota bacterium]